MRIIGGTLGGRRFYPPAKGWPTRPTTDIAREGLYNILQAHLDFETMKFLDLFGGTGAHSLEVLSRGCRDVTYVDQFRPCCAFIRKTAAELGFIDVIQVICADAFRFCRKRPGQYSYIFAGPPYGLKGLDTLPDLIFDNELLADGGWFVLEHNPHHDFSADPRRFDVRNYGETWLSFFRNPGESGNRES